MFADTIAYSPGQGVGAQIGLDWHPTMDLQCGNSDPNASPVFPGTTSLYRSPEHLTPTWAPNHTYSAPVNVSLRGLHLEVSKPGARLGLSFVNNAHNMQVLLPIKVEIGWAADGHGHGH